MGVNISSLGVNMLFKYCNIVCDEYLSVRRGEKVLSINFKLRDDSIFNQRQHELFFHRRPHPVKAR